MWILFPMLEDKQKRVYWSLGGAFYQTFTKFAMLFVGELTDPVEVEIFHVVILPRSI